MAVNPGFSRQAHLPLVHKKISELAQYRKQNNLNFDIQVDGGVTDKNSYLLHTLGTDIVVAGGAVFNYPDYKIAVDNLRNGVK